MMASVGTGRLNAENQPDRLTRNNLHKFSLTELASTLKTNLID